MSIWSDEGPTVTAPASSPLRYRTTIPRAKYQRQKESQVTTQVMRRLKARVGYLRKMSLRYLAGFPDILYIENGVTMFIELKATGKLPSKLQIKELKLIRKAGGHSFWCDDADETLRLVSIFASGKTPEEAFQEP